MESYTTYSNGFSFKLVDNEGKEFERNSDNYYYVPHSSEFKIIFKNNNNHRANVEFFVDGTSVGSFRSDKNSKIELERPVEKQRRFTFVALDSEEGKQGRLDLAPKLGNILITIDPEDVTQPIYYIPPVSRPLCDGDYTTDGACASLGISSARAMSSSTLGGTVLGSHSNQTFGVAKHMRTTGKLVKLSCKMVLKKDIVSLHQ